MGLDRPYVFQGYEHLENGELDEAETTFRAIADAGEPRGWQGLGRTLLQREEWEGEVIRDCFRKAAQGGVHGADFNCGLLLLDDKYGEPEPNEAITWLAQSARQGRGSVAASRLGRIFSVGEGVSVDVEKAVEWYEWAIALEDEPEAWLGMAALHADRLVPGANTTDVVRCAIHGGLAAQRISRGFPEEARGQYHDWIQLALNIARDHQEPLRANAATGDPDARYWLSRAIDGGFFGGLKDEDTDELLQFAANQGQPDACYQMAVLKREGTEHFPADMEESAAFLEQAAEGGDADAAHDLAFSYLEGYGVDVDLDAAMHWYRQAAEGNSRASMRDLAIGLLRRSESGQSPDAAEEDEAEALQWLREAALRHDVSAMLMVAPLYRDGVGTERDLVEAFRWFMRPINFGNGDGLHEVHQFVDEMSAEELVLADRLADGDESWISTFLDDRS